MCNWQDCCSELCCLLQKMGPSSQFHCVYPSCPPTHHPAFTAYIIWRQLPHPGLQACGSSRTVILFHGHIYWFKDRWTHNSIRANKVTEDGWTLLVQKLSHSSDVLEMSSELLAGFHNQESMWCGLKIKSTLRRQRNGQNQILGYITQIN